MLLVQLAAGLCYGQNFGGQPPGMGWQQLNGEYARVIFPAGADEQARRIASVVHYLATQEDNSIGERLEKIDIVLQNQTTIPNGSVGLAPYRSNFYATPFQSYQQLGTTDWLDQLAIHEFRHVQQFSNARRGLTKLASWAQGQLGWLVMANLSIPDWFWEGDAVVAETALSEGGRGRMPSFSIEQRALLLNDRFYSYRKARNGSYLDLVPNHYPLGFTLTSFARDTFGNEVWRDVIADAASYRSLIYPFSRALKRQTGMTTRALYRAAYERLEQAYEAELATLDLTPTETLSPLPRRTVTNYRWPHAEPEGSVLALKDGYRHTPRLVRLSGGEEETLTTIGFQIDDYLSVTNGRAVWTELEQDPRWYNRNYSVLVTYNTRTGIKRRLTQRSKLLSPQLNASGNRIVAVRSGADLQPRIVLLSATDGQVIDSLPNPNGWTLAFPRWLPDESGIVFLAQADQRLALFRQQWGGELRQLTDWTTEVIDQPAVAGDRVYFSTSATGIDNIFSVALDGSGQLQQLTSVPVGAYMPSLPPGGDTLLLSEFTDMGYTIAQMPLAAAASGRGRINLTVADRFSPGISAAEGGNILARVPPVNTPIQPYNGLLQGIQLHSWSFNGSYTAPGMELLFENVLSNLRGGAAATYNRNEDRFAYRAELTYAGLYPWIQLDASVRRRRAVFLAADSLRVQEFQQNNYGLNFSLPLRWRVGNFTTELLTQAGYDYYQLSDYNRQEAGRDRSFGGIDLLARASHLHRQARQHLQPRWGASGTAYYQAALSDALGSRFWAKGSLYLPGLLRTHGIRIDGSYQHEALNNPYQFVEVFAYPRGYSAPPNDRVYGSSINYQLPLFYPDWGFAGITYFKRIRANLFLDQARYHIDEFDFSRRMRSVGAEIFFDNTWLNVQELSVGVRGAYLLEPDVFRQQRKFDLQFFVEGIL